MMKVGIGVFVLLVLGIGGWALTRSPEVSDGVLTFSSTMTWGEEYAAFLDDPIRSPGLQAWEQEIVLPPFPANDSLETRAELDALLALQASRTQEDLEAIQEELELSTTMIGDRVITEYFSPILYPATSALFKDSFLDLSVLVMKEKERFNRVRPSFLEPALAPAIENPQHPAYPSGHATQSHFIAVILGTLNPERAGEYLARADEIARHREIAGVHYASDSAAGKELADQVIALLLKDPGFQELLEAAQEEWLSIRETAPDTL